MAHARATSFGGGLFALVHVDGDAVQLLDLGHAPNDLGAAGGNTVL